MKLTLRFLVFAALCSWVLIAQNAEIVPNENLIVEGVSKIPTPLAETVERYTNYRSTDLESWDPQKREMLIRTRFADTAQVHLKGAPGGARTQLTFCPDSVRAGPSFHRPRETHSSFRRTLAEENFLSCIAGSKTPVT